MSGFYLRPQVRPFIIFFIERDGSTYLTSLLISHPNVHAVYERFAVMRQKGQTAGDQIAWARRFWSPPLIGTKGAIGFKTKLVDVLDPQAFARLMGELRVTVVQMHRHNSVKAVVSRINARRLHEESGHWNLYKEKDRIPPLQIDHNEFDQFLRERKQDEKDLARFVDSLGLPTLDVSYEELLTDRDSVLEHVFDALGVPLRAVVSKSIKHTSDDLRDAITNFDELRERYLGTRYYAMFDEVAITKE
ncbi:MAG: hypothetical protein WBR18_08900 [Anaerolineales bacterium]